MFVAPYSASINKFQKKELKKNIYISENNQMHLVIIIESHLIPAKPIKNGVFQFPKRWDRMSENDFFNIVIETDVFNDEMIIGEITVKGK